MFTPIYLIATIDRLALALTAVGSFTGIALLVSRVWQYRLSGPRLRVEIKCARIGWRSMLTGAGTWNCADARTLAAHPTPAISVHVVNRGRMAATVASWGVDIGARMVYCQPGLPHNPRLPVQIEPGGSVVFVAELAEVVAGNRAATKTLGGNLGMVYGEITRADGKTIRSRSSLRIPTRD